jgi:aryl-alcohol dehydrogenase-like predicted oxidoreductase
MNFQEKIQLGKTGLMVNRLGIASSYSAPAAAYEEAYERGCNYFTWGSFIKGRSRELKKAMRNIIAKGVRDKLVISFLNYSHSRFLTERSVMRGLRLLGTDYVDVFLLGWYMKASKRWIDGALKLKERGIVKAVGITSHNRPLFPELAKEGIFDIFHVRYNAANSGAEQDVFPHLDPDTKPGIVVFTATKWGQLLDQKKMPEGYTAPTAADCYRFVLSNPNVDVCMMGAKNIEQMRENLNAINLGPLSEEEMNRMRKIGDYVYGR